MITIDCPECHGEGKIETLIRLSYDGDQTWRIEECPTCHGDCTIEVEEEQDE